MHFNSRAHPCTLFVCSVLYKCSYLRPYLLTLAICTCTKYEHSSKQYLFNSQLSRTLLPSPKSNIFNYLTDVNLLT